MSLLECVPNVSEGRDQARLQRLVDAAGSARVRLLDRSSDPDHHRAVLTLAGEAQALVGSVGALCKAAVGEIDLRAHDGVHPRLGAVDVVPFVPVSGAAMTEAVGAAFAAGAAIAASSEVPVMLYGEAARDPTRRELASHRRGGLPALAERMASGEWPPDFGPSRPHPSAGVVCVGARAPLVAFNLLLDTGATAKAREIARRIRESTPGGLPGVKALGLYLPSRKRAQVSVNLVDASRTCLLELVQRVRREARSLDAQVESCELVGLATRDAVHGATAAELGLPRLGDGDILELRLEALAGGDRGSEG